MLWVFASVWRKLGTIQGYYAVCSSSTPYLYFVIYFRTSTE